MDYKDYEKYNDLYIDRSNASRCFYNFYTTKQNYILMNKICESLTYYNGTLTNAIKSIKIDGEYNSIHFRFGDRHKDKNIINRNNIVLLKKVQEYFKNTKIPLNQLFKLLISILLLLNKEIIL